MHVQLNLVRTLGRTGTRGGPDLYAPAFTDAHATRPDSSQSASPRARRPVAARPVPMDDRMALGQVCGPLRKPGSDDRADTKDETGEL